MIAVFGLKADFEKFRNDNRESKHLFKLVTDDIEKEFCGYSVEGLIFLQEHYKGYPNLLKTYTKVSAYVRGPRCEAVLQQLKELIEIESTVSRIRKDMISVSVGRFSSGVPF